MIHTITAVGLLLDGDAVVLDPAAEAAEFGEAARAAVADDKCGSVVCAVVYAYSGGTDQTHAALSEVAATSDEAGRRGAAGLRADRAPPPTSPI